MAVAGSRKAIIAVLVIIGLYFLVWHKAPLPGNHEVLFGMTGDITSTLHLTHDIIGLVLIIAGVLVWRKSRTVATPVAPSQAPK